MKGLAILGSTGSIGKTHSRLFVSTRICSVRWFWQRKNVQTMFEQCLEFKPRYAVLSDEVAAGGASFS